VGVGVLWSLVKGFIAALLRRGAESRDDFTTVANVQESLIDGLRKDNSEQRDRCDLLQKQFDRLIADHHAMRMKQIELDEKLGRCEAQHRRDGERIAELERKINELTNV
jgi:hypothetical protein